MMIVIRLIMLAVLVQHSGAFVSKPTSSSDNTMWGVSDEATRGKNLLSKKTSNNNGIPTLFLPLLKLKNIQSDRLNTIQRFSSDSDSVNRSETTKIIIAGAPASGKGTQCEKITAKYGVVHLSTGDMLRAAVAAGTEVGMEAKAYMDAGKLVPDSTMIGIVKDRLQQEDCQTKGWLLDGFPRTEAQAKALEEAGIIADCFVFLNVPDEVLVERVVGRRTDPVTGKIYHMIFSPPQEEEVRLRLQQRSDDTEEKVKVRLEQFHANVEAVKGSYAGISVTINGNQDPSKVSEQIFEAIGSLVMT